MGHFSVFMLIRLACAIFGLKRLLFVALFVARSLCARLGVIICFLKLPSLAYAKFRIGGRRRRFRVLGRRLHWFLKLGVGRRRSSLVLSEVLRRFRKDFSQLRTSWRPCGRKDLIFCWMRYWLGISE